VGDSRTDGFLIYSGIGQGKNLTSNGLSIFQLADKKALTIQGKSYTLLEALALEQYGKVYLSLGVNELGYYNDEGFYRSYCQAIDEIRALQPNAVIYIQGLIPLNEAVIAQTSGRTYLTNDHLRVYNELMRKAAEEKQVVFLDLYSEFVDADGELPAEASKDGVHLRSDWCKQWLAYLQTHTVDFETLYPTGALPSASAESGAE
jgi:lysophospholipase L1-like esterase